MNFLTYFLPLLRLLGSPSPADDELDLTETRFTGPIQDLYFFPESDIAILRESGTERLFRSTDVGRVWKAVTDIPAGESWTLVPHPRNPRSLIILGPSTQHWITEDWGNSWTSFQVDGNLAPVHGEDSLAFHPVDGSKIIINGGRCDNAQCERQALYTLDGFRSIKPLRTKVANCVWGPRNTSSAGTPLSRSHNRVVCRATAFNYAGDETMSIVTSDDFFHESDSPSSLVDIGSAIDLSTMGGIVFVTTKLERSREKALFINFDSQVWRRAVIPASAQEIQAYNLISVSDNTIWIDITMTGGETVLLGASYSSHLNDVTFTLALTQVNRNTIGAVDLERVQNMDGILLTNTITERLDEELRNLTNMRVQSYISFDEGHSLAPLRADSERLHIHSVTEQRHLGRKYSRSAPGLVIGAGNLGEYLNTYAEADLYASHDAGLNWRRTLVGPHLFAAGNLGSILVAVQNLNETDSISYSLDHAITWKHARLPHTIRARQLFASQNPKGLKMIVIAADSSKASEEIVLALDFSKAYQQLCKHEDGEEWHNYMDSSGEPLCVMGQLRSYWRRKSRAKCSPDMTEGENLVNTESCPYAAVDYALAPDAVAGLDIDSARPASTASPDCLSYSSDLQLNLDTSCQKEHGLNIEIFGGSSRDISNESPDQTGIRQTTFILHDSKVREYFYLADSKSDEPGSETVVFLSSQNKVYITRDEGRHWRRLFSDRIIEIYRHRFFSNIVYFITTSRKVIYSEDGGRTLKHFKAPSLPNQRNIPILEFHEKEPKSLIWMGSNDSDDLRLGQSVWAYVSIDGGDSWAPLLRDVRKCQFTWKESYRGDEHTILCEQYRPNDVSTGIQLISSPDWFDKQDVKFSDVVDFAQMAEFIVVAIKDENDPQYLKCRTSIDGSTFAEAHFPRNLNVTHQTAYTVLGSSTHAIFLHVTVNSNLGQEFGAIIRSNSNGTSYVLSAAAVNRNALGFVDFEKMDSLPGVALVNIVSNFEKIESDNRKKLKTLITHNDGAEWSLISPPSSSSGENTFECSGPIESCSLHLHGFTERSNLRSSYSSKSAVGLMIGVGNVGEYLHKYGEGDTFVTRDGGISWQLIKKGVFLWAYGDQGAILVIVREIEPTNTAYYSYDEGLTWEPFKFSDDLVSIHEISNAPNDTSRRFLLWGYVPDHPRELNVVNIDFSDTVSRLCVWDTETSDAEKNDYYLWEPKHPLQKLNCLFGHVSQYYRKKVTSHCYNGQTVRGLHKVTKNCSCTREDYECDYNYERQNDGSCALVLGLSPADHALVCESDSVLLEYHEPTGYRRIPLTTCVGGKEMDLTSVSHPCPGREEELYKAKKSSKLLIFMISVVCLAIMSGAAYFVYGIWSRRYGSIRLGSNELSSSEGTLLRTAAKSGHAFAIAALDFLLRMSIAMQQAVSSFLSRRRSSYGERAAWSRPIYSEDDISDVGLLAEDDDEEA